MAMTLARLWRPCAIALALLLVMAGGTVFAALANTPAPLRVGATPHNKPWEFRSSDGTLIGFEADLVREIAARLGRPLVIEDMHFGDLFTALDEGRIDIAMSSLSITRERRAHFDFTQPYYQTSLGMVVMRGSPIRSLDDLRDRRVSVVSGTTSDEWAQTHGPRYGLAQVRHASSLADGLNALAQRQADAHIGDLPALIHLLLGHSDLAVVARLGTQENYGLMLAKGSPLTQPTDEVISRLKRDGTLARIHQAWFGSPPEPGSPVTQVLPRL